MRTTTAIQRAEGVLRDYEHGAIVEGELIYALASAIELRRNLHYPESATSRESQELLDWFDQAVGVLVEEDQR